METTAAAVAVTGPVPQDEKPPASPASRTLLEAQFDQFYTIVYRYLLHRLFDRELAEELTAETFFKALRSARTVHSREREMQMWLLRIATNLANSHYRKVRLRHLLFGRLSGIIRQTSAPDPAGEPNDDRRVRMRAVLRTLPPKYQTVLTLRYYQQMSFEEIAATIGCREVTVRSRLSRAVRQLRERLGQVDLNKTNLQD